MLKSCSYCNKIHDRKYKCPNRPSRKQQPTHIDKFRKTNLWQKKRKEIAERDKYLCQVCIRKLHNTKQQYNFTNLEVHHIDSIASDWDKRLDDNNLISLCKYHHSLAELGKIGKDELVRIVEEQETRSRLI
jgi:5-methylcytosine-specific restriction endonuclease McrA